MQILLGEVRFVVISSRETAKEVMKTNENIIVDRPDGVIPRIVFYNGKAISFTPYGEYWKQLRKSCSSKLLSPQCVRSLRSTMEEEVSDFVTSISSKEGSPINLSKMLFTLTFGLISRVILGKKGKNQALLSSIEEWKQGGAGFDVADIFPSFKLFHSLGWARSKFVRQHQEIGEMLETIINERRASKIRTKTSEHEIEEDFLDVLANMQHSGNLEFTNDNIKAILLVSMLSLSNIDMYACLMYIGKYV
jgi:cytochrome P450